ncbi:hypothetical protein [Pseudomonas sp. Irchel 3A5]|uniref:hypothetical protein n=1 Tax=Pseudomonas sp. Irchel 3A5 TaxID=2008911 RepID=UPI000BA4C4D9|nr:hypothetical protein [Pseudomonas sp. Irchel 3A5]
MSSQSDYQADIDKFQRFVFEMDDVMEVFIAFATGKGFRLDYSIASLGDLELFIDCLGDGVREGEMLNRCSRYVGEVFRRNLGGCWDLCLDDQKNINFRLPVIDNFSDIDLEFCPLAVVSNYVARKKRGLLRDAVEANREFLRTSK